jgi:signal transduction histidine kinase
LKEQKEINIKGLAHDIKTPLTIIYSFINTLQKGNTVTVKQSNTAFLAANNINDLLGVLLEENYQSNVKVINLSTILEGKIQEYSDVFKSKTMTLNLENTEDVFTEWNSRDFKRILDNLISNAFYYSKINSSVQIKLSKHEKVELIIESEPINKNEIDLDNMFEKGFRGHESSKSNQSGKGLGLYLCKILLLPVNGKIDAHIVDNKIIMTVIL